MTNTVERILQWAVAGIVTGLGLLFVMVVGHDIMQADMPLLPTLGLLLLTAGAATVICFWAIDAFWDDDL